jgi:hypothetical protein
MKESTPIGSVNSPVLFHTRRLRTSDVFCLSTAGNPLLKCQYLHIFTLDLTFTSLGKEPVLRVYLDNCCFNRPFDDQSQTRIRIETEAKLRIQTLIREGKMELIWSYMLDFENEANPFEERRITISGWRQYAAGDMEESEAILKKAETLYGLGLKAKDALHISCAIVGACSCFLTTDDQIITYAKDVKEIKVMDPTALIREMNL